MGAVGINFGSATGGTGFDVTTTVASIVANLTLVENPWTTQLTTLKADNTALTSIGTDLSSLSTAVNALTDFEGVMVEKEGSSSDTNVLTLTSAGPTATAGSHTILVGQLAQTSSEFSDPIAAADTISGGLTFQVGTGAATTIPVVPGTSDTLATYAASINAAGIGVSASVISDTTGSRLSFVSETSGLAGQLTVTQGGTTTANTSGPTTPAVSVASDTSVVATNTFILPAATSELSGTFSYAIGGGQAATVALGSTPLDLNDTASALNADTGFSGSGLVASVSGNTLVVTGATGGIGSASIDTTGSTLTTTVLPATYAALSDATTPASTLNVNTGLLAQDAKLTVDGVGIDASSNTVSTAIPGVTFQLLSKSTIPVQAQITNDNTDVETAFATFVAAYNTVLGDLKTQEGNTAAGTSEPLFANPVITHLQSALSLALTSGAVSGSIKSLDQLGITVTTTGTLALDNTTLDAALNSNYSDVVGFMQNSGSFGQMLSNSLDQLGSASPVGAITLALAENTAQETTLNDDVTAQNVLIATDTANITTELNNANEALQSIPAQLNEMNELYSAMTGYNTTSTG
jgi:flagellar hook-associated protein 2